MGGGGGKGGGGGSTTIGYKYHLGMHMAVCHGADELQGIRVGERCPWSGSNYGGSIYIDAPDLFGGPKREGGVVGQVDVMPGGPTQVVNDYLQAMLGAVVPAFRGVWSFVLRRVYLSAMNPYIKPWSFLMRRTSCAWYGGKCAIGSDRNPAHIIYECLTDTVWGMGHSTSIIDDDSFRAAADTLYSEDFGLSFMWSAEDEIQKFVQDVLRHIDGVLYLHPRTGLWTLKLMRGGYDTANLQLVGPSQISELASYVRMMWGELVNQLTLKWTEVSATEGETERSITLQNPAGMAVQGQVVANTVTYNGVTNATLAMKLAQRDLRQQGAPLTKITIKGNRALASLYPGDPFRFSWPDLGIEQMIMRAVDIDYGSLTDGAVTIQAVEDAAGLDQSVIGLPTPSEWQSPITHPAPAPNRALVEIPYYVLIKEITGENEAILSGYDPQGGIICMLAQRPAQDAMGYQIMTNTAQGYVTRGSGQFTPTGTLVSAVGATDTQFNVGNGMDLTLVATGTIAYIDGEIVLIKSAIASGLVTVARGMLDTVPAAHAAGARIWFSAMDDCGYDPTEYGEGANVSLKCLPRTAKGTLAEASAPVDSITMQARAFRPYPPGNVRLNGSYMPTSITGPLVVTWAHRDRKQQTTPTLIEQGDASVGPEAGTTYTLRLYGETGVLKKTVSGVTGATYTWDTEQADCGLGRLNTSLRLELEAVRDGYTSWQKWSVSTTRP